MRYDGAAEVDVGGSRFADFVHFIEVEDDWMADDLTAQVRLFPDAPGNPLVQMYVIKHGYVGGITTLELRIDMSNMTTMPPAPEPGGDAVLAWDMRRKHGTTQVVAAGKFVVHGGVDRS